MIPEKYSSGAPPTYSIWFHPGLLHTILHERLGIFESYYEAHYFWCYWRIECRLKTEEGFPGLEFIELVVKPLSIFRLLLVGWVGPAEAGYEVSLGSGNTCALDDADV